MYKDVAHENRTGGCVLCTLSKAHQGLQGEGSKGLMKHHSPIVAAIVFSGETA